MKYYGSCCPSRYEVRATGLSAFFTENENEALDRAEKVAPFCHRVTVFDVDEDALIALFIDGKRVEVIR